MKKIIPMTLLLLIINTPISAKAHEITRQDCRRYAAMHAFTTGISITRFSAARACNRAAKQHLLQHPLPDSEIPVILRRIRECESGGNYRAENSSSTASGAYQYLDSTWGKHMGFERAMDAPPRIQDLRAIRDYNNVGTDPWLASKGCWG